MLQSDIIVCFERKFCEHRQIHDANKMLAKQLRKYMVLSNAKHEMFLTY